MNYTVYIRLYVKQNVLLIPKLNCTILWKQYENTKNNNTKSLVWSLPHSKDKKKN